MVRTDEVEEGLDDGRAHSWPTGPPAAAGNCHSAMICPSVVMSSHEEGPNRISAGTRANAETPVTATRHCASTPNDVNRDCRPLWDAVASADAVIGSTRRTATYISQVLTQFYAGVPLLVLDACRHPAHLRTRASTASASGSRAEHRTAPAAHPDPFCQSRSAASQPTDEQDARTDRISHQRISTVRNAGRLAAAVGRDVCPGSGLPGPSVEAYQGLDRRPWPQTGPTTPRRGPVGVR